VYSVPKEFFVFMMISMVTVGSGFVLHEMGHKLTAIYYGGYARFQMWVQGLLFMLMTSLFGILFAAPGAVYIYAPNITKRENGLISLSGPIVNFLIMLVFFAMSMLFPMRLGGYFSFDLTALNEVMGIAQFEAWRFGAYINFILCMFNMLPVFPLDGSKIFGWSKLAWVGFLGMIFFIGVSIGLITIWFAMIWFFMLVVFSTISTLLFGRRR
jgi:Zn-dependent protease